MHRQITLALSLLLITGLGCKRGSQFPELNISPGTGGDSVAYVHLVGPMSSLSDTLHFEGEGLCLNPDTALYSEAYLVYPQSDSILYFRLEAGAWGEQNYPSHRDTIPRHFPVFSLRDVTGRYWNSYELIKEGGAVFVFGDHLGKLIDQRRLSRLTKGNQGDRRGTSYLSLLASDSTLRNQAKRDSLKGVLFSDSIGEVSRLRQELGIARSPRGYIFWVDSNALIKKHQVF